MKFELVKNEGRQRFYKSDTEIKVFPRDRFVWNDELAISISRLRDGFELLDDKCFYVCVSDARTHIERLVFAAGRYKDPEGNISIGIYSMLHIDGRLTFMIHGGDPESVKDDMVYLRHIAIANSVTILSTSNEVAI